MSKPKRVAGRPVNSPSGEKRVQTTTRIDPHYKAAWEEHGNMPLSQLLEWAIKKKLGPLLDPLLKKKK